METIKKCSCGENNFIVCEYLVWKASVDQETGNLEATKCSENGISQIQCATCSKIYTNSQFNEINFN